MKRLILLFLSIAFCIVGYGQLTLINVGTSANDRSGDPHRTAFQKTNLAITQINTNTTAISLKTPITNASLLGLTNINRLSVGNPLSHLRCILDSISTSGGNIYFWQGSTNLATVPGTGAASWGAISGSLSSQVDLTNALGAKADATALTGYVPTSTTVNGHALSGNVSVTASDVSLGNVTNESKATMLTSPTITGTPTIAGYVPTSRTVNGHALTGNVSVTATDLSLGNVTNESKATMFTSPTFTGTATGSITGNAGTVTGFTPAGGSLTLSGADALTLTTTNTTNATFPAGNITVARNHVYNVLDYGVHADGITDDCAHIQAAINAAVDGVVYIPAGDYLITDSLVITNGASLQGAGWTVVGGTNHGTLLKKTSNKPILIIDHTALGWGEGMKISDICFYGSDTTKHDQVGIRITAESDVTIDRCWFLGLGGNNIEFGNTGHKSLTVINNCRFQDGQTGIYGRSISTTQLNTIKITNCNFLTYKNGIDICGNSIIITGNNIGCEKYGIYIGARDMGDVSYGSQSVVIRNNYMDSNKEEAIYVVARRINSGGWKVQYQQGVVIDDNYFYANCNILKSGINAFVKLEKDATGGGETVYNGFEGFKLGCGNIYAASTDTIAHLDAGLALDPSCTVESSLTSTANDFSDFYKNLSLYGINGPKVVHRGYYSGFYYLSNLVAVTGFTEAMLFRNIEFANGAAIDISASPQIADGFDGQTITIMGTSDVNTLTLDDGTGLALSAQFVMGAYDTITLVYNADKDIWVEVSRSNN